MTRVSSHMSQIPAWHSIRTRDGNVYHDHSLCPAAKAIPAKYQKWGHRCRPRCPTCVKLASPEMTARRLAMALS